MNLKASFAAAVLAAGLITIALPSVAATSTSFGVIKGIGAAQSTGVEQAAWWRRGCHWGFGGYHKWVPGVGRVQCTAKKCWTNSFGIQRCRWF